MMAKKDIAESLMSFHMPLIPICAYFGKSCDHVFNKQYKGWSLKMWLVLRTWVETRTEEVWRCCYYIQMSAYFSKTKEQNLNFKLKGKWVHNVYLNLNDMVTLVGELLNFTCAAIKTRLKSITCFYIFNFRNCPIFPVWMRFNFAVKLFSGPYNQKQYLAIAAAECMHLSPSLEQQ